MPHTSAMWAAAVGSNAENTLTGLMDYIFTQTRTLEALSGATGQPQKDLIKWFDTGKAPKASKTTSATSLRIARDVNRWFDAETAPAGGFTAAPAAAAARPLRKTTKRVKVEATKKAIKAKKAAASAAAATTTWTCGCSQLGLSTCWCGHTLCAAPCCVC